MNIRTRCVTLSLIAFLSTTSLLFAAETTAKLQISDVMKQAHKKPKQLLKTVGRGTATQAEKEELVKLYKVLLERKPPKGDAASWKAKTTLLVKAAEAALKGQQDAGEQLFRAANCMACHRDHKD
jgi:mono/diheme cytochrome c family protein